MDNNKKKTAKKTRNASYSYNNNKKQPRKHTKKSNSNTSNNSGAQEPQKPTIAISEDAELLDLGGYLRQMWNPGPIQKQIEQEPESHAENNIQEQAEPVQDAPATLIQEAVATQSAKETEPTPAPIATTESAEVKKTKPAEPANAVDLAPVTKETSAKEDPVAENATDTDTEPEIDTAAFEKDMEAKKEKPVSIALPESSNDKPEAKTDIPAPKKAEAKKEKQKQTEVTSNSAQEEPEEDKDIAEVKLSVYMIHSNEELVDADRVNTDDLYESVSDGRDRQWLDIWTAKQDFVKAGIGQEGIIAIHGYATATMACRIKPDPFANFTKDFLREVFGDLNVLSCKGGQTDKVFVHFLVYPLNIRQLNPNKWISTRTGQLKREIINDYVERVGGKFGVNLNDSLQLIGNGHTQYLDEKPDIVTLKSDIEEIFYDTITPDSQIQTDWPKDKIESESARFIKYFTTGVEKSEYIKLNNGDIDLPRYMKNAKRRIKELEPEISNKDLNIILGRIESAAGGFYILDYLINDEKISDIKVCSPDRIRVKVEGQRRTSNLKFIDADDYYRFVDGIMSRYKRSFEDQIHVFTDKVTNEKYILRNNLTLAGINSDFPTYHIRKVPRYKYSLPNLIEKGMMDKKTANYLIWAAREAKGMLFTGKGSAGKTTLMNTLLEYTPADSSGICVQESEELFSTTRPEITFQHIWGPYDLDTLAKNALLTDIDYYIIGEIKGDESQSFIRASNTGNKAWASVHGSSSTEAIDNLCHYIISAEGSKYSKEQALYMLKDIQVVVFMKNWKVAEISEVTGWDPVRKELIYKQVLKRDDILAMRAH